MSQSIAPASDTTSAEAFWTIHILAVAVAMPPASEGLVHNDRQATKDILIAEDDDAIREILEDLLSSAGYRVIGATDGLEALDWLSMVSVDLVIVDILLPRLGGLELIKHLRQSSRWAETPIMVLSAFADLERYKSLPVEAVQLKPFHISEILEHVERLIGTARVRPERPCGAMQSEG
jgi:DNA-binding response OmpR family regulator